jgi:23S rRNA (cytosine1962-C5)-methyltransferase
MSQIDDLSQSGYIQLERTIPVPEDVTGYTDTIQTTPPADPSPFNHPTKITILRVSRKDKAVSNLHY